MSHRQSGNLLAALHVPQPGRGVHTARGHQGALWAERQADLPAAGGEDKTQTSMIHEDPKSNT